MEKELEELELMNENENREFYVYVHIRKDNNTVFYVGKGTKNRAYDLDRGNFHNGVRDKYGCRVEIIKDGLTESQAFRLESKMIKYYVITLGYGIPIDGYRDYSNNKYLTNFTWGGEGTSGHKRSEESKEKMRGEKNPMFGKNLYANKTPEEIEKIKRKISEKAKGRKHSEEQNKKISEAMKGEKNGMWGKPAPNRSKVMCITTGENFDCIKDAAEKYNIYCTSISHCCNGKYKHAGKLNGVRLQWKYLEDDDDNDLKAV